MHPRAEELISKLHLQPHPEGGFFKEIFRSPMNVLHPTMSRDRSALTTIYFLLTNEQVSRWHRIKSEEIWHFYEGDPLELFCVTPDFESFDTLVLHNVSETARPAGVVPAECWQAARTSGEFTLLGCSVAPGFDYSDFCLISEDPMASDRMKARYPDFLTYL